MDEIKKQAIDEITKARRKAFDRVEFLKQKLADNALIINHCRSTPGALAFINLLEEKRDELNVRLEIQEQELDKISKMEMEFFLWLADLEDWGKVS